VVAGNDVIDRVRCPDATSSGKAPTFLVWGISLRLGSDARSGTIRGLRELCEALSDQLAELRWRQLGTSFDSPHTAYRAMNRWEHEERAQIEAAGRSRDDEGKEEPLEIPSLRSLRQTTDA
jgi:hypothetical protein